jgi:Flp pilus assembly protein TadD
MSRHLCRTVISIALPLFLAAAGANSQPSTTTSPRTLVMPFENVTRNSRIFWLGEAAAVLITDDLNALGTDAITRDERRHAFDALQVPPAAALTDATIIRIGQLVGAVDVIVGSVELDSGALVVRARSIALEAGRVQSSVVERGPMTDLFLTFDRVARRLAPGSAKSSIDIERQHPPLPVFEDYIKGLLADTPATAIGYLTAALKREPTFDRARLALWDVYEEQGDHEQALKAVQPVAVDSPLARRAQFRAALAQLNLKRYDEAFAGFKALADTRPTATIYNDLGIVQLRRGAVTPQTGQPAYYFNKAADLDPDDPDYFFNLGYAYWVARDPQAAIYWLRQAVRRNAADGDAHFVLGTALLAAGNASEGARERELARRLSSTYEQWEKRPPAEAVPRGLERVKSDVELPHARRTSTTVADAERRDQLELAKFYVDRGRRLFEQENDREAATELNRALYLSPYDAEAHFLLGAIHLRNGRVRQAIDALKISLWSAETPQAHALLGEAYLHAKDTAAARAEAERALALDPNSADARRLVEKLPR